jgi:hypothetical protein
MGGELAVSLNKINGLKRKSTLIRARVIGSLRVRPRW